MMENLYTAAKHCGCRPLSPTALLPEDPLFRSILSALPRREGGFSRVEAAPSLPPPIRKRIGAELAAACGDDPQAFAIRAEGDTVFVYSETRIGLLYGVNALVQGASAEGIACGLFYAAPRTSYRGLKLYLPDPDELDEFCRIIDMACHYRHNSILLEVGGAMEYKRHPEINSAWVEYCADMARYPRRADEVQHANPWEKNSIHFENGGGRVLSQEMVRDLVAYCRGRGLEVIPEVPTLSHCDYLLNAHPELAERREDPFPDSYCPNHPKTYPLVFDVLDEVIEVFQPEMVHIGHDEFYSYCLCDRCRDIDPADLFANDVTKLHDYLAARGIRTIIWPEKLLDVRDKKGVRYGGAERVLHYEGNPEPVILPATWRAIDKIPRDIRCHHWYWELREGLEQEFLSRGMETTFGNFSPQKIPHWKERVAAGVIGGATSGWTHVRQINFQRDAILLDLVFGCYLNWGPEFDDAQFTELLPVFFRELFDYRYRETVKKPHLAIRHTTTILRPWSYITSTFVEDDPIGSYRIVYQNGRVVEIPIVYGVNITNRDRFWARSLDDAFDVFVPDNLLIEVSSTTLPERRPDGTTAFTFLAEDEFPDDAVVSVSLEQSAPEEGEIHLLGFERRKPTQP